MALVTHRLSVRTSKKSALAAKGDALCVDVGGWAAADFAGVSVKRAALLVVPLDPSAGQIVSFGYRFFYAAISALLPYQSHLSSFGLELET